MSHPKWLVTYSLREDVTEAQFAEFSGVCKSADFWCISRELAGKFHCHAYLEFNKPLQYVQLQRRFARLPKDSKYSLQIKKAYNYGALEYVVKDGSYETNLSDSAMAEGLEKAKFSKKRVAKGDLESILFEFCEYLDERGGVNWLLRSPDRLELQQTYKDFCAYKKEWKYVDKAFPCLRRLEYGAEVLYAKWTAFQKETVVGDEEGSRDSASAGE